MRNGIVKVTLHFAEIYWGVFPNRPGSNGPRKFFVWAENIELLSDYDIFAAAGGPLRAVKESFEVSVSDGVLDLSFYSNKDLARISAIEIERKETQNTLALAPVADAFVRKAEFSDSNFGSELTLDCKNGTRENLYRESYLKFSLASLSQVSTAKLRIYGYNFEGGRSISMDVTGLEDDAWTENGITAANAPTDAGTFLGNIRVKQQKQYLEIDVTNFVKAQLAGDKSLTLMIKATGLSNARVVFNSRENSDNPPQLEIITTGPVTSQARLAYKETMTENEGRINASSIYPNPVIDRIMVNVSDRHSADVELQLLNVSGTSYQAEAESRIVPGEKADINISNLALRSGLYLLKVHSKKHSEVLKVLVAD